MGTNIWIDSVMRPRSSSRGAIQVPQLQIMADAFYFGADLVRVGSYMLLHRLRNYYRISTD